MENKNIKNFDIRAKHGILLAIAAFIIYYGFILIAATLYPGGYNFFTYYYSDLGRTIALNGDNNFFSLIFFITGTLITGLLFIPFWLTYYKIFSQSIYTRNFGKMGSIFGLLAIPNLFGIALIPINVSLDIHALFSISYYLAITLSLFCYSIAIIFQHNYANINGFLGFLAAIFEILFIIGLFTEIEPLVQKLTSICFALWIVLQYLTIRAADNSV